MKTSLSEIVETEKYLTGDMRPEDAVVFQARLLTDRRLKRDVFYHVKIHRIALLYRRKKIKAEIQSVHKRLFDDPVNSSFKNKILQLFNS